MIKDEEEAIFFITPTEDSSAVSREDTGLWTDCKAFVSALKAFFDGLWSEATDVEKRIEEIETGKPLEETVIVRDAEAAYKKFHATVSTAEERIIGAISSKDLTHSSAASVSRPSIILALVIINSHFETNSKRR